MKKYAVISVILDEPDKSQKEFNHIVSEFKGIIKGRMGLPINEEGISLIAIAVYGEMNTINEMTGKIGQLKNVSVKTAISKR